VAEGEMRICSLEGASAIFSSCNGVTDLQELEGVALPALDRSGECRTVILDISRHVGMLSTTMQAALRAVLLDPALSLVAW